MQEERQSAGDITEEFVKREESAVKEEKEPLFPVTSLPPDSFIVFHPSSIVGACHHHGFFLMPLPMLMSDLFTFLWPAVHKAIPTDERKQPLRATIAVPSFIQTLIPQPIILLTHEDILNYLGSWQKKTFKRGSYALIVPKVTIECKQRMGRFKIHVTFFVKVYNPAGTIQWPLQWE
jgi:hypothetical protein